VFFAPSLQVRMPIWPYDVPQQLVHFFFWQNFDELWSAQTRATKSPDLHIRVRSNALSVKSSKRFVFFSRGDNGPSIHRTGREYEGHWKALKLAVDEMPRNEGVGFFDEPDRIMIMTKCGAWQKLTKSGQNHDKIWDEKIGSVSQKIYPFYGVFFSLSPLFFSVYLTNL
jgi:hypothetical protein